MLHQFTGKRYSNDTASSTQRFSWNIRALFLLSLLSSQSPTASAFSVQKNRYVNSIHRIVFGTAALSKAEDPHGMLDAAFEKGVRRFDLARTYGMGESERIFGEWLESRNIDAKQIDLITKGGIGMDRYGDPDRPLLTHESLSEEVDTSLSTLKVDSVGLYMFHRDDARLPVGDFVEWINTIVASGKVKRWGASNWSFERFMAAHKYALDNGLVPPTANSPQYSLAAPVCDVWPSTQSISQPHHSSEIEWYAENDVELICWEVLAKGFMAKEELWPEEEVDPTTFNDPVVKGSDEWRVQRIQKAYCNPENYRRRDLAIKLAKKSNLKLAQVAMLYPLTKGQHISVIFGSSKTHHLDDMVALQHFNIDETAMSLFVNNPKKNKTIPFIPQFVMDRFIKNVREESKATKASVAYSGNEVQR
jgi:aryl-alcohol dehydrogenase-like predicted oxidoreductase